MKRSITTKDWLPLDFGMSLLLGIALKTVPE